MSLFKSSEESLANLHDKILFWGAPHTGKTHTALTWPGVALVDVENRGAHFADRVKFQHAEPRTIEEVAAVLKELRSGALPCETFVFDSYSAMYEKLCILHTKPAKGDKYVTDYTTVNKRIADLREFAFGVARKNVIFIAHAGKKYEHTGGEGGSLKFKGVDFVGEEKFRFAFDYVFRVESNGDPRVKPATFVVEKSATPNVKVGQKITGLDYAKFIELTRGAAQKPAAAPPLKGEALADAQATGQVPTDENLEQQIAEIGKIIAEKGFPGADVARVVRDATSGLTTDYRKIKHVAQAADVRYRLSKTPARQAS